jgi:hypothetical protein
MDTIRDTFAVDMQNAFHSFTIEKISAGKNRLVEAYTIDTAGDTIHGKASYTVTIEQGQTAKVPLTLNPVKGSLYLQLTSIPALVDSVLFSFVSKDKIWAVKQKKSTKMALTLDKIPYNTIGTLSIVGYGIANDTIASWIKEAFEFKNANTTVQVSFVNSGKIIMEVSIIIPGVTTFIGIMNPDDSLGDEKGRLIVSEIMYAADDSEYVEIYNPDSNSFTDTIILYKDNDTYRFFYVTIPAYSFYVIGRDSSLPWADAWPPAKTALDLSSASGNWITLRAKDSSIMDMVPFLSGNNSQGWPYITGGKKSIVLDSLVADPEYNNYGRHWVAAKSFIDPAITQQLGTPGKPGI